MSGGARVIERLERMYALVWQEGDLEAAFEGMPEDFEWVVPGHPDGDVHRGRRGALHFFRDWLDQWDAPDSEWQLEQTGPETVFALTTTKGRGKGSGVPVELTFGQVWTFREGVPVRMVAYLDPDKGRRAARGEPADP